MTYHILPTNDIEEHRPCSTCHCEPKSEFLENGDSLIVHHSFDGREMIEEALDILNRK